jgi:hypothetical protein
MTKRLFQPLDRQRRRFLQGAAVSAGALAAPTLGAARGRSQQTIRGKWRIGVVTPSGQSATAHWLAGARLFAEGAPSGALRLLTDATGTQSPVLRTRRLLEGTPPDGGLGLLDRTTALQLAGTWRERGVRLSISGLGAAIPRRDEGRGGIVDLSLPQWSADWALGHWAVSAVGPRIAIAQSALEGGHDNVYAFRRGVETAGGRIVDSRITHLVPGAPGDRRALAGLLRRGPDAVFAGFSGADAGDFLRLWRRMAAGVGCPLLGTGQLVGPAHRDEVPEGTLTAVSWDAALPDVGTVAFVARYRARYGQEPHPLAAAGYTAAALTAGMAEHGRVMDALDGLRAAGVDLPLAEPGFDPASGTLTAGAWLRRFEAGRSVPVAPIIAPTPDRMRRDPIAARPRSGLGQPYLGA